MKSFTVSAAAVYFKSRNEDHIALEEQAGVWLCLMRRALPGGVWFMGVSGCMPVSFGRLIAESVNREGLGELVLSCFMPE